MNLDPTLKTRTITSLKKILPDLSPRLGAAAKYIVDNASDFGLDPIRETARKAGVSTYSLVRLAEKLGFDGYDELREPFRHALVSASAVVDQPCIKVSLCVKCLKFYVRLLYTIRQID